MNTLTTVNGLVVSNVTVEEKAKREAISFFEKTVAYAAIFNRISTIDAFLKVGNHNILAFIQKWVKEELNKSNTVARKAWSWAKEAGVEATFKEAVQTLKSVKEFNNSKSIRFNAKDRMFVKPLYNGFSVSFESISPNYKGPEFKGQRVFTITTKTDFDLLSRVLIVGDYGIAKAKLGGNIEVFGNNLNTVVNTLPVINTMMLIALSRAELGSLEESSSNFLVIDCTTDDEGDNYARIGNSYKIEKFYNFNATFGFFGVSNPDVVEAGVVRKTQDFAGFYKRTAVNEVMSIEGGAGKVLARCVKLSMKDLEHKVNLDKVFVVTDTLKSEKAVKMLSTGCIYVPSSVMIKHGQCRVVSGADQGGFKATFSPVGFADSLFEKQGISVASFGSIKAKLFGINSLLGTDLSISELNTKRVTLDNVGTVEGIFVKNVELTVTNHYTIQQYFPTNRDRLLANAEMATKAQERRALVRSNTIEQDVLFLNWVIELRDTVFNGNLSHTLQSLEESGEIQRKPKTTSITPSEFDLLALMTSKDNAKQFIDELVGNGLNGGKVEEFKRVQEFLTGNFENVVEMSFDTFYQKYVDICNKYNINVNTDVGGFANRDFLVSICNEIFYGEQEEYRWVKLTNGKNVLHLPLGDFMFGSFYKTSTVYEESVAVTGFLGKMLKYIPYGASMYVNGKLSNSAVNRFTFNVINELQCELVGKKLGKLKATGLYGVLSPAWWAKDMDTVFFTNAGSFSKARKGMLVKHPILFLEAITTVNVKSRLPKRLIKSFDQQTLADLEFALASTVFCSEEVMLTLQNDADGDLTRLTFHKGEYAPMFSNRATSKEYFANKFHENYVAKEKDFTGIGNTKIKTFSNTDIMDSIISASICKQQVGSFTSLAQKFGYMQEQLGYDYDSEKGRVIRFMLNTFVQEFAMNDIKQKDGKAVIKLPEYFLSHNIGKDEFVAWEGELLGFLEDTLKVDMGQYGFGSNKQFANEFYKTMSRLAKATTDSDYSKDQTPAGVRLTGKDLTLAQAAKKPMLGTVKNPEGFKVWFKGGCLQNYLVSKFI